MTKEERIERKDKTYIIRRVNSALRQSKIASKSIVAQDSDALTALLARCKTQAQMIDVSVKNNMSISETATSLVAFNLCKTIEDAEKRIKRHRRFDADSRIAKRAVSLLS